MGYTAVPTLMFVTLAIVLAVAVVILMRFLRKPGNRHPMENQRERNIDEIRQGVPRRWGRAVSAARRPEGVPRISAAGPGTRYRQGMTAAAEGHGKGEVSAKLLLRV